MSRGGGTRCLFKQTNRQTNKPSYKKTQKTTAAAPQHTNQPSGLKKHTDAHSHKHTPCCCFTRSVHFRVFVSSSGCLNLFLSHNSARETARDRIKRVDGMAMLGVGGLTGPLASWVRPLAGGWMGVCSWGESGSVCWVTGECCR